MNTFVAGVAIHGDPILSSDLYLRGNGVDVLFWIYQSFHNRVFLLKCRVSGQAYEILRYDLNIGKRRKFREKKKGKNKKNWEEGRTK